MIRVRALGQNVIEVKRRPIRPDAEVLFATLLYLGVERGRRVERETIAAMFWPREDAARRRHSLRQILYKLRRLGVETGDAADALTIAESDVWLDFQDMDGDDRRTLRELSAAGGVRCLPAYAPKFSKLFSDWLEEFRTRAESAARRRLVAAIASARRGGRWEEVEPLARNCLQLDPLNEEATLALAETTALAGAKSKAVAMLDAYTAELGPNATDLRLPADVLRRRIADQLGPRRLKGPLETKLIGREDIMEAMTAALEKTKAGHAATHVLWGPSGIGKTRVLEEVAKLAALMGATTVSQRAATDDVHTPGLTLIKIIRAMLAAPGSLGLAPDVLALLQRLTAQTSDADAPQDLDLSEDALVRGVVDLERSLAWERTLVIVLDDFHHADEMSRRALSRAQGCLSTERVLLVMASLSKPPASGLGRMDNHSIARLSPAACSRLASLLLERVGANRDPAAVDALAIASGGHPLMLREAVLVAARSGGGTMLESIESVMQQRHAALSDDARDALLSVIVLASHACVSLLLGTTDIGDARTGHALGELEQEHVVTCLTNGRITVHSIWTDSVERFYPPGRVAVRRLRVAQALESSSKNRLDSAERLLASAEMFQLAGDERRAAVALARGGTALQGRALAPGAYAAFSRAANLDPASDQFEECLFQSLAAAHQGDLVEESAVLIERFAAKLRRSPQLSEEHQREVDVIAVEVRHAVQSHNGDSRSCLSILSQPGLTDMQRLRVALVGVQWAEQNHDPAAASAIVDAISSVSLVSDQYRRIDRKVKMAHAICTRDIKAARALADSELAQIDFSQIHRENIRTFLNNRIPFWLDCDYERVAEIINIGRIAMQNYSSTFVALRTEDIYATHCIEMLRVDEAAKIVAESLERASQFGHKFLMQNFLELRDRLRIARRDKDSQHASNDRAWQPARDAQARLKVFPLCNEAIMRARVGVRAELEEIVAPLAACWEIVKRGCPFDYPCFALAIVLSRLGRERQATEVLDAYFANSRVATHRPSPFILSLVDEFSLHFRAKSIGV